MKKLALIMFSLLAVLLVGCTEEVVYETMNATFELSKKASIDVVEFDENHEYLVFALDYTFEIVSVYDRVYNQDGTYTAELNGDLVVNVSGKYELLNNVVTLKYEVAEKAFEVVYNVVNDSLKNADESTVYAKSEIFEVSLSGKYTIDTTTSSLPEDLQFIKIYQIVFTDNTYLMSSIDIRYKVQGFVLEGNEVCLLTNFKYDENKTAVFEINDNTIKISFDEYYAVYVKA